MIVGTGASHALVPRDPSRAYERTSLLVTTNLPFESWTEVLGTERLAGAPLDRLTHRIHILEVNGESYPMASKACRTISTSVA